MLSDILGAPFHLILAMTSQSAVHMALKIQSSSSTIQVALLSGPNRPPPRLTILVSILYQLTATTISMPLVTMTAMTNLTLETM